MKNNRRAFFFDIDGTLTSEQDGSIPPSVPTALSLIRSRGDLTFINTGRALQTILPEIRAFGFDGYVLGCGTSVCDRNGDILWKADANGMTDIVLKAARESRADILFEGREQMAFAEYAVPATAGCLAMKNEYRTLHYLMTEPENPAFIPEKFVAWTDSREEMEDFLDKIGDGFLKIDRGMHEGSVFFEFAPAGCSKAEGLKKVLELFDIAYENTYAFGDSNNDLEMLRAVKHSVVMGNSSSEYLRADASYITDNASADGILKAVRYFETGEDEE